MDSSAVDVHFPNVDGIWCKPGMEMFCSSILSMRDAPACNSRIKQLAIRIKYRLERKGFELGMPAAPSFRERGGHEMECHASHSRRQNTDVAKGFVRGA